MAMPRQFKAIRTCNRTGDELLERFVDEGFAVVFYPVFVDLRIHLRVDTI
jgi:hypothetical protein